jgi:hypothetical protein
MRSLARRFQAHQFWDPDNSRFELRLLAQPLHRYEDPDRGLVEGGLFILANNTNPEVVLLLEAARHDSGAAAWQYALARLGHAEMHVSLDDVEVWSVPRVDALPADSPYWLFYQSAQAPDPAGSPGE